MTDGHEEFVLDNFYTGHKHNDFVCWIIHIISIRHDITEESRFG